VASIDSRKVTRRHSWRARTTAVLGALSVVMMSGGLVLMTSGSAQATQDDTIHKSYVCKYVNKPGGGTELDQTGQNPIWVDNHSIAGKDTVAVGDKFADAHGYSVVIVANTDKLDPEPSLGACGEPEQPPATTSVTPSYPSATDPTCAAAGHLVVPSQPSGVTVSGGAADGSGPGSYTFTYAPASSSYVFPAGTATSKTVTVLGQKSGDECSSDVQPTLVTPNAPSQTEPTCTTAGSITAPAAQTGVVVTSTDLGNGAKRFDSAPATGYTFGAGNAQSVSHTVTAKPKKTGAACAEVEGTDDSTDEPSTPTPGEPEVEGTNASRTPPVVKAPVVKAPVVKAPVVKGTSAVVPNAVPNAVDAGLAGAPLTDVRVLVGQALLGGGLLFLAGAAWSGLGLRRRGDLQA
jgi:hypothetical protein